MSDKLITHVKVGCSKCGCSNRITLQVNHNCYTASGDVESSVNLPAAFKCGNCATCLIVTRERVFCVSDAVFNAMRKTTSYTRTGTVLEVDRKDRFSLVSGSGKGVDIDDEYIDGLKVALEKSSDVLDILK